MSKEELRDSSMGGSPFVQEVQDKPTPHNFWLLTLEAYNDSFDPTEHVIVFSANGALWNLGRLDVPSILDNPAMASSDMGMLNTHPSLPITIRKEPRSKMLIVSFMMVKLPSTYNAILDCPTLNKLRAVISTYHYTMKFPTSDRVSEARSDPQESKQCYLMAKILPKKVKPEAPIADP
ncbi:hypothetical protein BHE74_00027057 [Ensete ventricosum]|nr:hypothetical protein BHE74_00027057 [Ensete ventricosum]